MVFLGDWGWMGAGFSDAYDMTIYIYISEADLLFCITWFWNIHFIQNLVIYGYIYMARSGLIAQLRRVHIPIFFDALYLMGISEDQWDTIFIAMGVSIAGIPRWKVSWKIRP